MKRARSKKRIFWVAHEGCKSGANNAMLDYAEALSDKYDITIIMPSSGAVRDECIKRKLGAKVFYYYSVMRSKGKRSILLWVKRRLRNSLTFFQAFFYFLKHRPGIVITNSIVSPPLFAILAFVLRIKHIWYLQEFGNKDHGIKFEWGYKSALRYINFLSAKVIVVSDALRSHVSSVISPHKITTVFNRVNVPEIFWGKGQGKTGRPFKILHLAQVAPGKNQLEGIKALKILIENGKDLALELAGSILDAEYKNEIDKYILEEDMNDKISFSGFSDNPFEKISDANAVILCSRSEACALTIFETLRIGTPMIVSNTGGNIEIINDMETGLVYQYGNPEDLAGKIDLLYSEPELATKISGNARNYSLQYYHINNSIEQIIKVIETK